jgi:hypothetical protein
LLLAGLALSAGTPARATPSAVLYVDRNSLGGICNDQRLAVQVTRATPWCSLPRAVAAAPAGSTVLVRAGSYSRLQISGQSRASKVTLKAYPGETASLPGGFYIYNSSNFRLEGFRVTAGLASRSESDISDHIDIVGNEFTTQGMLLKAPKDTLVEDNHIHDLQRQTPNPSSWGNNCDGCGIGTTGYYNGGAQDNTVNLTIRGNVIRRLPMDAITVGGGASRVYGVLIAGNEVGYARRVNTLDHTDGIQLIGGNDITIRDNFIHNGDDAMYIGDDWHRKLTIENNLLVSGGGCLVMMKMTPGARVINNTFWNSGYKGLCFGVQSGNPTGLVMKNNIIDKFAMTEDSIHFGANHSEWFAHADYNLIASGPLYGRHSARTRPTFANRALIPGGYFRNPVRGDYRLTSGSAGVDAGTSGGAPATDLTGIARYDDPRSRNKGGGSFHYYDIGALEFFRLTPSFGAKTRVTLKLAARRIPARGPLRVRVSNANRFAVKGRLWGQTRKRVSVSKRRRVKLKARSFRVGPHARRTIRLRLPRALRKQLRRRHKLSLLVIARVRDPAGHKRIVRKKVSPRLKGRRRR